MPYSKNHQVVVTGYGIVSSLGVRHADIWSALNEDQHFHNSTLAAPYLCHPVIDFDALEFINSKPLLRAISRSQLHAMVAVERALDSAGLGIGDPMLTDAPLIVACGDGNRDEARDEKMYAQWFQEHQGTQTDFDQYLNEHFSKARPSNFLAQLPNIYATNIACHFSIGGESITFIGDELAGMNAIDLAINKIANGESNLIIVGGAADGIKEHLLLYAALEGYLCKDQFTEVWQRKANEMCLGSGAGFLILESADHAEGRNAQRRHRIHSHGVAVTHRDNPPEYDSLEESALAQMQAVLDKPVARPSAILSCSAGSGTLSTIEAAVLKSLSNNYAEPLPIRSISNYTGGLLEAALPHGLAMACLCLEHKRLFKPLFEDSQIETQVELGTDLQSLLVNCWGHYTGEASILIEAGSIDDLGK